MQGSAETDARPDLDLYFRVREGLHLPPGEGWSIDAWVALALARRRWKGRKLRAAIAIRNLHGWPGLYMADRILRGMA